MRLRPVWFTGSDVCFRWPVVLLLLAAIADAAQSHAASSSGTASPDFYAFSAASDRGSFRSVLRPVVDVSLSARAAGIVEAIHVQEGSPVKANQPIISLDSDQERADLAQAEASARGAKADMDRATTELQRITSLRQDNVYSEKQFLDAKAQAEVASSRYEQAQAALQLAKVRLANRDIISPIDGIFLKTNKLVGEAVERYETVARVVDITSLEMLVFCDAKYFSLFREGQKVDVKVLKSAEDQPIVSGTVYHVDPIIDPSSGTFRVKVRIMPSDKAMPGLSAILIAPST
jgi:RND family efflux transporter MFP subunit